MYCQIAQLKEVFLLVWSYSDNLVCLHFPTSAPKARYLRKPSVIGISQELVILPDPWPYFIQMEKT